MKLLKYFQKTKGLSRQEFEDMIKEKAILVNEKPVESFDQQIQV
jgi:16S rRNA U516 pseudouridylate synthase RsuA-like enzyme